MRNGERDLINPESSELLVTVKRESIVLETLTRAQKQTRFVAIIAVILFSLTIIFFFYRDRTNEKRLLRTIDGYTKMEHEFTHDDLDYRGQKELYRKQMMKIFRVYGFVYNKRDVRALEDKEKARYINLCFDLANDLGGKVSRWDGPVVAIHESSFNPRAIGPFGEKGLYGMKGVAAWDCYGSYLSWSDQMRKKYPINYSETDDLYDYYTSTVLFYAGMHSLYKLFLNSEAWVYSSWHYGPTVLERFFEDGNGALPSYFTFNGIKYSVDAYWTSCLALKDCFEAGQLEAGKPFQIKW